MADESSLLCNSTKNHLQLALDQPTKYGDDIEAGGTFPDTDEEHIEDGEEKGSDDDEEKKDKISSKIPPLYQVEPGCTSLSCYSAIIAFIIMSAGILWLLLISPPKNSVPVPMPVASTEQQSLQAYDILDGYEDDFASSSTPTSISTTLNPGSTTPKLKTSSTTAKQLLDALQEVVIEDSGP